MINEFNHDVGTTPEGHGPAFIRVNGVLVSTGHKGGLNVQKQSRQSFRKDGKKASSIHQGRSRKKRR